MNELYQHHLLTQKQAAAWSCTAGGEGSSCTVTLYITLTDTYLCGLTRDVCVLKRRARNRFCYSDMMWADVIYDRSCRWSQPGLHHAALAFVQHVRSLQFSRLSLPPSLPLSLYSNLVCPSALCHCNLFLFSDCSESLYGSYVSYLWLYENQDHLSSANPQWNILSNDRPPIEGRRPVGRIGCLAPFSGKMLYNYIYELLRNLYSWQVDGKGETSKGANGETSRGLYVGMFLCTKEQRKEEERNSYNRVFTLTSGAEEREAVVGSAMLAAWSTAVRISDSGGRCRCVARVSLTRTLTTARCNILNYASFYQTLKGTVHPKI